MPLTGTAAASSRPRLKEIFLRNQQHILACLSEKNAGYFEQELDKLDRWGEDQRNSLKLALREIEDQIKDTRKQARLAHNLPDKLKLEREKRQPETKRDEAWRAYDIAAKEIEHRKDALMDEVEQELKQQLKEDTASSSAGL